MAETVMQHWQAHQYILASLTGHVKSIQSACARQNIQKLVQYVLNITAGQAYNTTS